ncbi:uncharacterized protein N7500_010133 [Penicillium coprophilum]|uniref:uncharacterized protein n=1 Tax=Penicillium coprophilum TaxID=36646 RepID=UPI00238CE591|nr:uncharacterized protein N7500_010133 [Penicillium coprophilum]KAJ5154694.1 hypothetical protein N7500_010133 [Penicillium coprophilum]
MAEPTSSPFKRFMRRFRGGNGGAGSGSDPQSPSSTTPKKMDLRVQGHTADGGSDPRRRSSTTPKKDLKRKDGSGDDDDSAPAAKRPATARSNLQRARDKLLSREPTDPGPGTKKHLPLIPKINTALESSGIGNINPNKVNIIEDTPTEDQIKDYRIKGADYLHWMTVSRPAKPCKVTRSTLTMDDILKPRSSRGPEFRTSKSFKAAPPRELNDSLREANLPQVPRSRDWQFTHLERTIEKGDSSYQQYVRPGAIVASSVYRHQKGPRWTDIILALYKRDTGDTNLDQLRYIFWTTVENEQTLPLVGKVHHMKGKPPGATCESLSPTVHTWERNSPEFLEILGSELGRATACIVLGAWRPGTHRIFRIYTWFSGGSLHMRFDIEAKEGRENVQQRAGLVDQQAGRGRKGGRS